MKYEINQKEKDIYKISFEDGSEAEIHMAVIDKLCLWTKQSADEETITRLLKAEAVYVLQKKACSSLAARAYSSGEMTEKLKKYESDEEIIKEVVENLKECDLIDDMRYAKDYAYYYMNTKHCSIREAYNKMTYIKKIPPSAAHDALSEYEMQETENLEYLINRRYGRKIDDFNDYKQVCKVKASLCRLGFAASDIDNAIEVYRQNQND